MINFSHNGFNYRCNGDAYDVERNAAPDATLRPVTRETLIIETEDGVALCAPSVDRMVVRAAHSAAWAYWTTLATRWEVRAAKYGPDMSSSRDACLRDAEACHQRAALFGTPS